MTGNLRQRIYQHKSREVEGFTRKYNLDILIYCEEFDDINDAKMREKAMKKWNREWKENLINRSNPKWEEIVI